MTKAKEIIDEHKLKMSLVVEELGYAPETYQGLWTKRIKGEAYMTPEQAANLESVLEDLTNEEFDEPLFEPKKYKCI